MISKVPSTSRAYVAMSLCPVQLSKICDSTEMLLGSPEYRDSDQTSIWGLKGTLQSWWEEGEGRVIPERGLRSERHGVYRRLARGGAREMVREQSVRKQRASQCALSLHRTVWLSDLPSLFHKARLQLKDLGDHSKEKLFLLFLIVIKLVFYNF